MGYCPFFQYESRYNRLYRDTRHWGVQQGGHDMAKRPSDTAPRHGQQGPRYGRPASRGEARMAWPGLSRDTKIVSWLGAAVCVAIWRNKDAIKRCDMEVECCDTAYDTVGGAYDTAHDRG